MFYSLRFILIYLTTKSLIYCVESIDVSNLKYLLDITIISCTIKILLLNTNLADAFSFDDYFSFASSFLIIIA